ncbi:disulfide bond formation protein B [Rhodoferax ferrireducens]|uniref:disulfide bond formation protein B n=1 Tax=Rhodoferax ferrireducens TaxID=192843 RepID=UPI00059F0ACD|nr:disulfide bond formation protein B [Rhodoferax ferrireducens]
MFDFFARPNRMLLIFGTLCLGAVIAAVSVGLTFSLEVCSMCWFQRLALILAAIGLLLTATGSAIRRTAQRAAELSFVLGWVSSCRQVYLLFHQEAAIGSCGRGLVYFFKNGNYFGFFRSGLVGGMECATDQAAFLGLPIPVLSLMVFTGIGLMYLYWLISMPDQ